MQAARAQPSHLSLLLEVGYVCTWPESCTLSSKLTFFTAATATHPFRLGSQSIADITYRRATKDAPSDHNVSDKQRSSADDTVWFRLYGTESGLTEQLLCLRFSIFSTPIVRNGARCDGQRAYERPGLSRPAPSKTAETGRKRVQYACALDALQLGINWAPKTGISTASHFRAAARFHA